MSVVAKTNSKLDEQVAEAKKLHLAGELKLAQRRYEKLLKKAPKDPSLVSLMGGVLLQRQRYKESIPYLEQACKLNETDADLPYNLGLALFHLADFDKAILNFQLAIQKNSEHDRANFMLARTCVNSGKKEYRPLAIEGLAKDIQVTDRLESHVLLAEMLHEDRRNEEARSEAKIALARDPKNEIALFVLGKTLLAENFSKALVDVRTVEPIIKIGNLLLSLYPNSWRGHHLISEALAMIGENELAIKHYQIVNKIVPDFMVSRTNTGVLLLKQGRLKEGWEEISYRKHHGVELYGMDIKALDRCKAPLWKGEIVAGQCLLIASEQGIGDQFIHTQMIFELIAAGMKIIMTCTPKITSLMSRSIPEVQFFGSDEDLPEEVLNSIDYKAELLDLGKYLRTDFSQFERKYYYLRPDPSLAEHFKTKYRMFGDHLKVGIAWKSISRSVGTIKSTKLVDWAAVLRVPGVQFINIQYGEVAEDIQQVKTQLDVEVFQDDFDPYVDIEKAVAQISALDLVISVSNAAVHMAGQLQIPTWVLLNSRPLWHWFEGTDRSVWYDDFRLFRQQQLQDWKPVLEQVGLELMNKVEQ